MSICRPGTVPRVSDDVGAVDLGEPVAIDDVGLVKPRSGMTEPDATEKRDVTG